MGKRVLTPEEAAEMGLPPEGPGDDGPDVSGLNDKSKADDMPDPLRYAADPTTASGAALQKFAQGASFKLSDELQGIMGGIDEAGNIAKEAVGLQDEPEALADPLGGDNRKGMLERILSSYKKNRNAHRNDLDTAQQAHPVISTGAEVAGAVMAPGPKVAAMPAGASRLARMANYGKNAAPLGAAFGFGGSEEEDVSGVLKDTAIGAGISGATGAAFGGLAHGPLSRLEGKEREAIEKAEQMAREAFDKPQRQAQGALGGVTQTAHRDLEAAREAISDPALDPAISKALQDFLASPQGAALRNQVMANKAESLPGKLSEAASARAAFDAAKAANTPEAVAKESARILGPERFKEASMTRLKKYAGRVAPPFIGSAVGGALGGSEGAMGGALAGSIASAALGSPGTALANYMRDPSVMLRLAQLGQSPATQQAPAAAMATLTSEEEERQRLARYLGLLEP